MAGSGQTRWDDVDAIVFDLFDTLVDNRFDKLPRLEIEGRSVPSTLGVLHERALVEHGVDFDRFVAAMRTADKALRARYYDQGLELPTSVRFRAVVDELGVGNEALAERLGDLHMEMIRAHTELPPHHPQLLERLRRGRKLALCSNFSHTETALRVTEEFGLARHLDVQIVSEAVGIRKPRREIFEATLEALGLGPERVLHVGDSLAADVAGAASLGIRTCWITRRVAEPAAALERHEAAPPDLQVADLAELEGVLPAK